MEKKEVTLHGSDAALGQAVAETNLSTLGRVPIRFVPNWLPGQGSNLEPGLAASANDGSGSILLKNSKT